MSFDNTASQIGTSTTSIQQLLNGYASEGIAKSLGISSSALQKFLNGQSSDSIADTLNITSAELQHLRNDLDKAGAIGFLSGLGFATTK